MPGISNDSAGSSKVKKQRAASKSLSFLRLSDSGTEPAPGMASTSTSPDSVSPNGSPIMSPDAADGRSFSLTSSKSRTLKAFSRRSSVTDGSGSSPRPHQRKLSKSERPHSRKSSGAWEDHQQVSQLQQRRVSIYSGDGISISSSSGASSGGWRAQAVVGWAPLEPDVALLKTKTPYLVVTVDHLIKVKSRSDAVALFPKIATPQDKVPPTSASLPEPQLVVPISSVVSAFPAESTRPSFGIEVWWRPSLGHSFSRAEFFFSKPTERDDLVHHIHRAMRAHQREDEAGMAVAQQVMGETGPGPGTTPSPGHGPRLTTTNPLRQHPDVADLIFRVHEANEPKFRHRKPEIFPVVPRGNTRKEFMHKLEDATKKPQEGSAFYLVIGTYLCHLVEIVKGKEAEPTVRHRTYGLVTLENVRGDWIHREERFNITFRNPFEHPVTLELASFQYRQIIHVFGVADRFLKPLWPQIWQALEILQVTGYDEPQDIVPNDDFGSLRRTLDAYLAGYRCQPVDWEINWKTRLAPEFRLLPPRQGGRYTPLQLMAVLRALRYNDYFQSLSFRDVDLSVLFGAHDNTRRKVNVAYIDRSCRVALGPDEIESLRVGSVLHQEFHALAFCSGTIAQMDLTNTTRSLPARLKEVGGDAAYTHQMVVFEASVQYLRPILDLLAAGITKCSRLLLGSNTLTRYDVSCLATALRKGTLHALDISSCSLDDASLREMIVAPLPDWFDNLERLSLEGNPGRVPAHVVSGLLQKLPRLGSLNLAGCILGDSFLEGPLIPFVALKSLPQLEELNLSGFKMDSESFEELERYLVCRAVQLERGEPVKFRKLTLNNCGIGGRLAARLLRAMGKDVGMHLSLSNNPLESGVDEVAAALREGYGPAALHMEMIEFSEEKNYLTLIKALTEAPFLSVLSLAGTAPSQTAIGVASAELVAALQDFFQRNRSIRCLDLSGFNGKLDDGQLPRGFGRSLSGLAENKSMTHLRVRNQNLHDDVGTLGRVLEENNTLMVLDVQDNSMNLTSLRFLVDAMRTGNTTIVEFPMSATERKAIWRTILRGLQRTASHAASPAPGTMSARQAGSMLAPLNTRDLLKEEEALLKEMLAVQFDNLKAVLKRNRGLLEERLGEVVDLEEEPMAGHFDRIGDLVSAGTMGGSHGGTWPALEFMLLPPVSEPVEKERPGSRPAMIRRHTVRSSAMEKVEEALPGPYHVPEQPKYPPPPPPPQPQLTFGEAWQSELKMGGQQMATVGDRPPQSPTDTLDPVSEAPTPPPVVIPVPESNSGSGLDVVSVAAERRLSLGLGQGVGDSMFDTMMEQFKKVGFDSASQVLDQKGVVRERVTEETILEEERR